ncbi:tectonin beta-propeller repeat-containing protein 1 isoform X2 [Betta splendens]|uniref:Tectonin beta-propeller repeat-containing protein 1 n=1 Tax=Betta splendens TaxID=158456 RepID=A0A6P7L486_BETSP|nr:tectonin beta-propeller repeat-containing protein 1 isoform X2 [Betta splendens]
MNISLSSYIKSNFYWSSTFVLQVHSDVLLIVQAAPPAGVWSYRHHLPRKRLIATLAVSRRTENMTWVLEGAAMPASLLWAVDVYGRIYSLSTSGQQWEQCHDAQLEFKRVAATQQCCWAIACDNTIYLNLYPSDLPVRCKEETYENQRWNPVDGFSERLLPSDRWQWSDVTGLQHQPLDSFRLPSNSWEWEGDWYIDENFEGEPTEKSGWTYAIDFPAYYTKDKKWNSCVRRRRWLRYRRYRAMDTWVKIPSQQTTLPDPFSDISCGAWEISEESMGHLSLWAVSLQGKVWFREGIYYQNPEGSSWEEIPPPGEVVQISCGPGDLVWAVMWEGQLIVREGISRVCPRGTSWTVVESPSPDVGAIHVAVGTSVVWVVTKDNKVWFRRGVNSYNPCGSGWMNMVGEMIMINVGLNDQVWGISCDDRAVYFRQGVTSSELSGKTWKLISVPRDQDRAHSSASTNSTQSAGCFFSGEVRAQSAVSDVESDTQNVSIDEAICLVTSASPESIVDASLDQSTDTPKPCIPKVTSDSFISELVSDREPLKSTETDVGSAALAVLVDEIKSPSVGVSPDPQWSNVELEEARAQQVQAGAMQDSADTCSLSSVATYTLAMEDLYGADEHPLWAWVSGGGCSVDSHSQLNWFNCSVNTSLVLPVQSMSLSVTSAQMSSWRRQIFEQLSERTKREMDNFKHYEQAIEQAVWVKKGSMQWWRDWKPYRWIDVNFALEQFSGPEGTKDGILFIYYNFYEEKKYIHAFINEVTILVPVLNDSKHTFAIYTPERTKQRWPIRLAAATEQEMHDWLALLSLSCCHSRGIHGPPSKQAIWSITCKGDVFVSEPSSSLEAMPYPTPCDQMFWRQIGGHLRVVECNSAGIVWGIGYDHTAWVYTGGYGGSFLQGLASSTDNICMQTDIKSVYIYENQRWNPVTGYTSRGLPTDRYMWSDASGLHECTKTNTKAPSPQWTWVSDWAIDYSVSGGTDREGWQYATDFPALYSGHKTMKDFVRRRRWARKCKLTTTGPWQEVPPILLSDVTILPCPAQSSVDVVPLWAISNKGDVLCRLEVTTLTPAGSSWLHVGTDQPFKSISIGAASQVWAIAKDGSAFYRGSVTPQSPAGDCWYHIPSPAKQKLKQVSVGRTSVYTVDENGNLWFRVGVTPTYPQGSFWEHISNNVRKVSVGPLDQVWIIADKVQGSRSLSCGTVCHRLGVQPMAPKGQSWDYGIGGGWDHITVRGNSIEPPRICLASCTESSASVPNSHLPV